MDLIVWIRHCFLRVYGSILKLLLERHHYPRNALLIIFYGLNWEIKHNYSAVANKQLVIDSEGETYWQDNANNIVWIKVTASKLEQFEQNLEIDNSFPMPHFTIYFL